MTFTVELTCKKCGAKYLINLDKDEFEEYQRFLKFPQYSFFSNYVPKYTKALIFENICAKCNDYI